MYWPRCLRFAAIALVPAFSLVGVARATTYDLSQDWANTWPTSTSTISNPSFGSATAGNTYGNVWTVGVLSNNWLNIAGDERTFQNFWNAGNGNLTSGATFKAGGTGNPSQVVGTTGTYTVPFQFYASTPGVTQNVNVGLTQAEQQLSGNVPYEPLTQSPQNKITNPTGSVDTVSFGNGYESYTWAAANAAGKAPVHGFSSNALQNVAANDGSGSVRDITGVFYNYSTTSQSQGSTVIAPAVGNDLLNTFSTFGPWAAEWIAPAAGVIQISSIFSDQNSNNGPSAFAILSANSEQTTAPTVLTFGSAGGMTTFAGGTLTNFGLNNAAAPYGAHFAGGTTSTFQYTSTTWTSGTITVTAGEQFYFATSGSGQGQAGTGGNHPWGAASDAGTIAATVNFTAAPEPSSVVLLGIAGIGFGLAAWRRRRSA